MNFAVAFHSSRLTQFCLVETVPIPRISPLKTASGTGFHMAVAKKQVHRLRLPSIRMTSSRFFQIRRAGGNRMLALIGEDGLTGDAGIALLQRPAVFMQMRVTAACALRHGKPSASSRRAGHPPTMENDRERPKPPPMVSVQIFHRLYSMSFSSIFPKPLVCSLKFLRPHGTKPHGNGHAVRLYKRGKTNSYVPRIQSRHRHFRRRKPFPRVISRIHYRCQTPLAIIRSALDCFSLKFSAAERRKQHAGQDRNDGDHN